jgi:hypothetical protein
LPKTTAEERQPPSSPTSTIAELPEVSTTLVRRFLGGSWAGQQILNGLGRSEVDQPEATAAAEPKELLRASEVNRAVPLRLFVIAGLKPSKPTNGKPHLMPEIDCRPPLPQRPSSRDWAAGKNGV